MSLIPAGLIGARSARAAGAEVRVFLNEGQGTISPLIHGHFIEHLGGVIYDGVWVGEDSKVPNIGGVIRWPGGCFDDSYDWRDGIGPRANRPRRLKFWASNGPLRSLPDSSPAKNDPNSFGTNEFLRFSRLIKAEPYVAANVRGMTALDLTNGSNTAIRRRDRAPERCGAPPMATRNPSMCVTGAWKTRAGAAEAR